MLPFPVSQRQNRFSYRLDDKSGKRFIRSSGILSRSRFTNLAVIILVIFSVTSLLLNGYLWLGPGPSNFVPPSTISRALFKPPSSISDTLSRDAGVTGAKHLVIVAGHAIWKGCLPESRVDERNWALGPEVPNKGASVRAFFSHIVKGAETVLDDPEAILIFSGGQTREGEPTTEGQSYHRLAIESDVFHSGANHFTRVFTEDYALDSFQNLLFSIARFHEITGVYPEQITVVGFGMKEKRFKELHRKALRLPTKDFHYIGIDIIGDTQPSYDGEHKFGYLPFTKDLYGCHGQLAEKRRKRNPHVRHHPYYTSSPELASIMDWCPDQQTEIFTGPLPWE